MNNVDVAVIGLGAHGSSSLYYLSTKFPQLKIAGIEKHTAGNQLGSSGGLSRIIRKAYFESPAYVRLLECSYELYRQLEEHAATSHLRYDEHPQHTQFTPGHSVLHITGGLDIGPEGSSMVNGAIAACEENNLPYQVLSPAEVAARWPIALGPNYQAVFQQDGGFLEPEKTNYTMTKLAESSENTSLFFEHSVIDVEQIGTDEFKIFMVPTTTLIGVNGQMDLKSKAIILLSKKIVFCNGPWIQDAMKWSLFSTQRTTALPSQTTLFSKLDKFFSQGQTQVQRQVVNWHDITPSPSAPTQFDSPNFPIFLIHHKHNYLSPEDQNASGSQDQPLVKTTELASASINNSKRNEAGDLIVDPSNTTSIDDATPYDHFYYGFPSMRPGDNSMKIGRYHHLMEEVHQDTLNRQANFLDIMATAHCAKFFFPGVEVPQWYDESMDFLKKHVKPEENINVERVLAAANDENVSFPLGTSRTSLSKVCTFTNTFDGHFLIQPMSFGQDVVNEDNPNIILLSCCSGHGFKFNSVVGEICADVIATGKSRFDIKWLGVERIPL